MTPLRLAGLVLGSVCLFGTACAPDGQQGVREIRERNAIRFLHWRFEDFDALPRGGLPPESYRRLAEDFASDLGVVAQWHAVDRFDELIPLLLDGEGDVIVANLMVSDGRAAHVAFSLPLVRVAQWVLARKGEVQATRVADLEGLSFGAIANSTARETIRSISGIGDVRLVDLPAGTRVDALVAQLAAGAFDVTVLDEASARAQIDVNDGIVRVLTLPEKRDIAWAVRPDSGDLLAALNDYITEHQLSGERRRIDPQDLAGIRQRGRLRMLTVTGPVSYYLWRGELMGFDYELLKRFARANDVELEVVLARSADELIPSLLAGRGDVVAASATIAPAREQQGVRFTRPYLEVDEVLVAGSESPIVRTIDDLDGRTVTVNPMSVYRATLDRIASERGIAIDVRDSPLQTEELIEAVAAGDVAFTVADSHLVAIEAQHRPLRVGPALTEDVGVGWVVNAQHTELLAALNAFIRKEYRRDVHGALYSKYFRNERRMRTLREDRVGGDQLSPFDAIVKPIAAQHGFDWRLIVAQMYEESEFNPAVRSPSGAQGLMQIVPGTAVELGIEPASLVDPAIGIETGVRYLAWTRSRFPDTLPIADRLWFTLAAYNAGPGHVHDARILARRQGWNGDRWSGSVDRAMLLLSKREFATKARHGYVRGGQVVNYVEAIRRRYQAYIDHISVQREAAISR